MRDDDYSITVKAAKQEDSRALSVRRGETVETLISRSGIDAYGAVIEIRLTTSGGQFHEGPCRLCEKGPEPLKTPPLWPDPIAVTIRRTRKRKKK